MGESCLLYINCLDTKGYYIVQEDARRGEEFGKKSAEEFLPYQVDLLLANTTAVR